MLMYGNADNIVLSGGNCVVYNLTSLREGYRKLPSLIPPNELGAMSGREFDIAYMNYIMSNDIVFVEFFGIIYSLYTGADVYIIVSDDDWSENLVESLIKWIQQRYGYNACKINCPDDYIFFRNSGEVYDFNQQYGVLNLDMDKERYTYIVEKLRIMNGGQVVYEE